jgi:hypothetical protein
MKSKLSLFVFQLILGDIYCNALNVGKVYYSYVVAGTSVRNHVAVLDYTYYFRRAVCLMNQIMFSVEKSYRRVVDNLIILLVVKFDSLKPDRL